ncbi:hypothetical protein UA18_03603 [Burkholderia multivorans]|uniref:LigA n=1 Tax=Burkholderia multivorans TaxID=87883 RepID=A0ABD7L9F4_9BURK|nr:hypothetical protein UA18_03603 [Burkholderia multivorans]
MVPRRRAGNRSGRNGNCRVPLARATSRQSQPPELGRTSSHRSTLEIGNPIRRRHRCGKRTEHTGARRVHRVDESRGRRDQGRVAADGDRADPVAAPGVRRVADAYAAVAARRAARRRAGRSCRSPRAAVARQQDAAGRDRGARPAVAVERHHAAGAVSRRPHARYRGGDRTDLRRRADSRRSGARQARARQCVGRRRGDGLQRVLRAAGGRPARRGRHRARARHGGQRVPGWRAGAVLPGRTLSRRRRARRGRRGARAGTPADRGRAALPVARAHPAPDDR